MGDASLTVLLMLYYAGMRLMRYCTALLMLYYQAHAQRGLQGATGMDGRRLPHALLLCYTTLYYALRMLYYQAHAQRGMDGRRLPHCNFQHERRARVCCLMR